MLRKLMVAQSVVALGLANLQEGLIARRRTPVTITPVSRLEA